MSLSKTLALVATVALATACKKEEPAKQEPAKASQPAPPPDKPAPPPDEPAPPPTPDQPPADGLKLTHRPAKVGDVREAVDRLITNFTIVPVGGPGPVPMQADKRETQRAEVLEVKGEVPLKVKVHYETHKETRRMGGKSQDEVSPLHGKTYIVWADGDAIAATTEAGAAVPEPELAELRREFTGELGHEDELSRIFRDRTWKIGEKVALTAEQLASMQKKDERTTATAGSITLVAVDGQVATFEAEIDVTQKIPKGELSMPMKLVTKVDMTTSRAHEVTMTGKLSGKVDGMQATGTLEGKKTFAYQ